MKKRMIVPVFLLLLIGGILTITAIAADSDFLIQNGTLVGYRGSGENIIIPDSVICIGNSVFDGRSRLKSVTIPDSVTSIGNSAFSGCSGLTSLTIPDSITSIGSSAFSGCSRLTSVTIPGSVTSIKGSVFSGCRGLTSVTIPDGVTSIGFRAFYDCRGLTNVTIPDSVISIGSEAFYSCSGLTSVVIGDGVTSLTGFSFPSYKQLKNVKIGNSVTSIGDFAFSGCSGLTSVTIPDSVTSIGHSAFYNCSELESITIGNNVTSIGGYAFSNCSGLTSIAIPNGVTSIEGSVFSNCSRLTSVMIPESVVSIGNYAFHGCSELKNVIIPNSVTSIGDNAFSGSGLVSVIIGDSVANISNSAFKGCSGLMSVTIPDSVVSIGLEAFYDCSGLTDVVIGDGVTSLRGFYFSSYKQLKTVRIGNNVTSIGNSAFRNCTGLTSVTIPNSVTNIGDHAFSGSGLTSIIIGESVTNIESSAFSGCSRLTSVTIPNSVTDIGNYAFYGCNGLTDVVIGDGVTSLKGFYFSSYLKTVRIGSNVTSIGDKAFSGCSGLTSIIIPDGVTSIGDNAFSGSGLTSVIIGENVTNIGDSAFSYCSGLTSVTIPDSVTSIGDSAFYGCNELTDVVIGDGVTSLKGFYFSSYKQLKTVRIGNSVTSIGNSAFRNCTGLTSVTIPDSVISVGDSAFSGCSELTSVTIGASVANIVEYAFSNCSKLRDVYYADSEKQWQAIQIGSGNDSLTSATLHCNSTSPDKEDDKPEERGNTDINIRFLPYSPGNIYYHYTSESVYVQAVIPKAEGFTVNDVMWTSPGSSSSSPSLTVRYDSVSKSVTASQLSTSADGVHTVSTSDGRSASFTVVSRGLKPNEKPEENKKSYDFYIGGAADDFIVSKKVELSARFHSYNSTLPEGNVTSVEWASSDSGVLAFDKQGLSSVSHAKGGKTVEQLLSYNSIDAVKLYALSAGTATVTCTVKIGDKAFSDEAKITVCSKESFSLIECCRQWMSAYETYLDKVKNALETYTADGEETIREQADELMKADQANDKLVTFQPNYGDDSEQIKSDVYYAVAKYLAHETEMNFDFSKIDLNGVDAASISASIVHKVCNMFKPVNYPCKLDSGTITITGMGGAVNYLKIDYDGEYVAQLITTRDKVQETITAFVEDLLGLENGLVKQAYKEMVKEVFGKTLSELANEKVKDTLLKQLQKHKPAFLQAGVGDIAEGVANCIGYYGHVKKVMDLAKSSPDELLSAVSSTDTFEFKSDTIENRAVAKAMKGLEKARNKLDEKLQKMAEGSTTGKIVYELFHAIFKCPVDITVYDSAGKKVGYVGDDDLWYDEDSIRIEQYGDAKHIYSYVGALKFDVMATEPGTLNCSFEEMSNGEAVERVNYYEVPLHTGKSLSVEIPAEALSAESVTFKSEGKTVLTSESFTAETYEASTVNVTCDVFNEDGGEVWGSGEYVRGDVVSLQAVPESGYVFLGWLNVSGAVVSASPVYEFAARNDVALTAMFAEDMAEPDESGSVTITTADVDTTDGVKVHTVIQCREDGTLAVYCVSYNTDGKMLDLATKPLEIGENDLIFSKDSNATTVKLFVLDEQLTPQCVSKPLEIT